MGEHPLPAGARAVATVREEEIAAAGRAEVDVIDGDRSCFAQRLLRRGTQVEVRAVEHPRAEARAERACDVVTDLVAAAPDSRADDGDERTGAECLRGGLDDSGEQSAPADMQC